MERSEADAIKFDVTTNVWSWAQRRFEEGSVIAVYRNEEIGHPECGHLKFLAIGLSYTFPTPAHAPKRLPDTPSEINWRYWLAGIVTSMDQLTLVDDAEEG